MSQLYATESGMQIPTLGEELTTRRRARKELILPATIGDARIYILAASRRGGLRPLRVAVNGTELAAILPAGPRYRWYEAPVSASVLAEGVNRIELWTDSVAMDSWSVAVEYGHVASGSWVSVNSGAAWSRDRIGHLHVAPGEYVVRVRLAEGDDPAPPAVVPTSAEAAGMDQIRALLPRSALEPGDTIDRARALATWTSSAWRYRNERQGEQYAPWDPMTILAWGRDDLGHDDRLPIVMCMHYAVVFIAACATVGISARPLVLADDFNGVRGHFAAEVWLPEGQRWVFVDPNQDAVFYSDGRPLSTAEVRAAGGGLASLVRWGPGHARQSRSPAMRRWIRDVMLSGLCFVHRGVWLAGDFTSRPDRMPPAHGAGAYSELDIVWEAADLKQGFGMFRYFADRDWFDAAPAAPGSGR